MQHLDRSTLENWVKFMAHNPHYFAYVFRVPLTEANLEAAAVQIFGKSHVLWEPTLVVNKYRHKPQRAPMLDGVKEIAGYLGVSSSRVYFYINHCAFPVVRENNQIMAYVGNTKRWAKRKQVGRFNNGKSMVKA